MRIGAAQHRAVDRLVNSCARNALERRSSTEEAPSWTERKVPRAERVSDTAPNIAEA